MSAEFFKSLPQPKFVKGSTPIKTLGMETFQVDAELTQDGIFAVHPSHGIEGSFTLTHRPTGMSFGRHFKKRITAVRSLAALLEMMAAEEWNFSRDRDMTTKHYQAAKVLIFMAREKWIDAQTVFDQFQKQYPK